MRDVDPHLDYTREQIAKNLILLEEHFKNYQCPVCISKHLLAIEGYAEEGIPMSPDASTTDLFVDTAAWARELRMSKQFVAVDEIRRARTFREKYQGASHEQFHGAHCHGAQCHVAEEHEILNG